MSYAENILFGGMNLGPGGNDHVNTPWTPDAGLMWAGNGVLVLDTMAWVKPGSDAKGGNGGGGGGGGGPKGGGDTTSSYTSGSTDGSGYNITIVFEGTWTDALKAAFIDAADYLSKVILGDVTDITRGRYATDDITITATLTEIDGSGGILGQAGPTAVRSATYLPVAADMEFDIADAQDFYDVGLWSTIVLHEMMHSIGFGTMWSYMGLTTGSIEGGDLAFTGAMANALFQTEFASIADVFDFIPIETDYGSGTAGGHWDEATFVNEFMTGFIDDTNYISHMTLAALEDMGYDTVFDNPNSTTDLTGEIPADILNNTLSV